MKIRTLKNLYVICISVLITAMVMIIPLNAYATTSNTQSSTIDITQATYAQLRSASISLPQNAQDLILRGGYTDKGVKSATFIPDSTKIYFTTDSTASTTTFYKFYTMIASDNAPWVQYYVYVRTFANSNTSQSVPTTSSIFAVSDASLYKQLKDGTILPNGDKSTNSATGNYTHKRLNTMIDVANEFFPTQKNEVGKIITLKNIVITTGTNFADSLSGTVLAAKLQAPILFMNIKNDAAVYSYVKSKLYKYGTVYILGGEGAVSSDIESKFKSSGYNVIRVGGSDRFDTDMKINSLLDTPQGTPVFLVSGEDFPDALSAGSVASIKQYPVLLTTKDTLPQQTITQLNNIKPSTIYVVGGTGVISDNVFNALKNYSSNVIRISGKDRYETSLNVCKSFNLGSGNTIIFATGADFKDALCGSSLAAKYNAPIILTDNDIEGPKQYLDSSQYSNIIILGPTTELSTDVENALIK